MAETKERQLTSALDELARRQGGPVARWQLRALGWSDDRIDRWLRTGRFRTVYAAVYRPAASGTGMVADVRAAMLAIGSPRLSTERVREGVSRGACLLDAVERAAFGHVFATAQCAGALRRIGAAPAAPQLLTSSAHHPRVGDIVVVRSAVALEHCELLDGVPIASGLRMLWDAAWLLRRDPSGLDTMLHLATESDARRLCSVDRLVAAAANPKAFSLPARTPRLLRAAAARLAPGFDHSRTEAKGRAIVRAVAAEFGLEVSDRPTPVYDGTGRIVGEADVAIAAIRLDIEIDGPHHRLRQQQLADQARDRRMRLARWAVERWPVELLDTDPERFAREVRKAIAARLADLAGMT